MTTETRLHRHWYVSIRPDSRLYAWLRKPRWSSMDRDKVEKSIFAWGYFDSSPKRLYTLSILGVLHGLTGLTLQWDELDD